VAIGAPPALQILKDLAWMAELGHLILSLFLEETKKLKQLAQSFWIPGPLR
jgi:hypothetical protein